jgi:hypothetical protein
MAITWDKQPSSRLGTVTVFTLSGSSQATATFGSQTCQVRVATSAQPAWFKIGDGTPTADTAASHLIGTNISEYFTVTPGQKAAVLQAGTAGSITVTEMS